MSNLPVELPGYKQPLFNYMVMESLKKDEILPSLDPNSYDMGLERFSARRVTPSTIWSDNGTNCGDAEKGLLACIKSWNGMLPLFLGVAWKFNPPGAPQRGGSWERRVRKMLYGILGSRRVTEKVKGITLFLVEQALNSRPRTPFSTDSR